MKGLGIAGRGYAALVFVVAAAVVAQFGMPFVAWALVSSGIFLAVLVALDALE